MYNFNRGIMPIDLKSNLYYESYGSTSAKTIVFLHGGGIGGWMWRQQVKAFQAEYHCLVPDLPEQGKNTNISTEPYTTEGAADLIAELILGQANGGKAHVVGISEGAQVVVALLSRHPDVIDHAMVSSAILRPMWLSKISGGMVSWMYRWFMAPFKNSDWWIRLNMQGQIGSNEDFFPDFKASFQGMTEASMVHMMERAMSFRMPGGMEKVNVPTLIVCGKHEYKEMRESVRDLVSVMPNASGAFVSLGRGSTLAKEHSWAMTEPEFFNATLKAWIENRPLPIDLLPLK